MEAEESPQEPGGGSRELGASMVAGVLERRLEIEMEGIPPRCVAVEGLEHMEISGMNQGPSYEITVARLR